MTMKTIATLAGSMTFAALAAHAGGYTPPVVEPIPAAPVIMEEPVGALAGRLCRSDAGLCLQGQG